MEQKGERDIAGVSLDTSVPLRGVDGLVELDGEKADGTDRS